MRVEPRTLKGFQDLLPEEALARRDVVRIIEDVFQRYGFAPVETPALEYLDVLLGTGGEETNKDLFRLQTPEGEDVALRFDLTVPFARVVAQYPDRIKAPIRRYAIGPVWRADKPGPGRFRQFTQLDVDAAGSDSVAVDGEIVAAMSEAMSALGAPRHRIVINNRKLIDALLESCGISDEDRQKHILRVVDKLQKVGLDNIRLELGPGRVDESGDPIRGVGLEHGVIDAIIDFIGIQADTREGVIEALTGRLQDSELARTAIAEMRELHEALTALGVSEAHAAFEPSLARGLDYYTGPVFEIALPDAPEFGSVGGGGRYNGLVERFLDRAIPATGMSIGLDRLMAALTHLGAAKPARSVVQALVVTLGNVPKAETLRCAAELRAGGIRTESFFGPKMNMKAQLSHADRHEIPVAIILGEDELAKGVVAVKDLLAGKRQREHIEERDAYRQAGKSGQVTVPREDMIKTVREML